LGLPRAILRASVSMWLQE